MNENIPVGADHYKYKLAKEFEEVCKQLKESGVDLSKIKITCVINDESIQKGLVE